MDSSKVAFSVMLTGNAEGDVLPPYVVYKSVHLYDQWVEGGSPGARYNRSQSGWFDETTFTDWFFKMILPKLRCLEGRNVLIGDNLSSHLSDAVIKACCHNNIAFVCLYPNATHLFWCCLVCVSQKSMEKNLGGLEKITSGTYTQRLPSKRAFPQHFIFKLLKTHVSKLEKSGESSENLVSGFRKCALYPFNPNVVYKNFPSEDVMSPRKPLDQFLLQQLQCMRESPVGEHLIRTRKEPD